MGLSSGTESRPFLHNGIDSTSSESGLPRFKDARHETTWLFNAAKSSMSEKQMHKKLLNTLTALINLIWMDMFSECQLRLNWSSS